MPESTISVAILLQGCILKRCVSVPAPSSSSRGEHKPVQCGGSGLPDCAGQASQGASQGLGSCGWKVAAQRMQHSGPQEPAPSQSHVSNSEVLSQANMFHLTLSESGETQRSHNLHDQHQGKMARSQSLVAACSMLTPLIRPMPTQPVLILARVLSDS